MGDSKAAAHEVQGRPGGDETFEVQQLRHMEESNWNEGRLDDLNRKVDDGIGRLDDERRELRGELRGGFEKVDGEFKSVRAEMKAGFERVDGRFERVDEEIKAVRSEMKAGFERMDAKFDRLTWSLLGAALAIVVALIGAPHI